MPFLRGVVDAICHFWTPFAICGRHLPISRGGGRHLPFMEGGWTPYAIYGGRGRHMPFMEGVDAICHFGTPFAFLGVVWTPFAICPKLYIS